jgi:hypothetical protein
MPIAINGTGTITGISEGGLPDLSITTADIADSAITTAKIANAAVVAADLSGAQTGSAPIYGVRAWCYFNGTTTGTNAPTGGGNVASVTRNGTGDYTITFSIPMPDTNYAFTGSARNTSQGAIVLQPLPDSTLSTSSIRFNCFRSNTLTQLDSEYVYVLIIR